MDRKAWLFAALFGAVLGMSSCRAQPESSAHLRELEHRDPRQATVARSYGWQAQVVRPQPQWHPTENILVVRGEEGLGILQEGAGGEFYTALRGGHEVWDPQWWGPGRVIFGPQWRPRSTDVPFQMPAAGMVLVEVGIDGITGVRDFLDKGYAPQPWDTARTFAQYGEDLLLVSDEAEFQYFGKGFAVVPQPHGGPGIAWQATPFPLPDLWTGHAGAGELVVRWDEEQVSVVPAALDAAWTPHGGVVATMVNDEMVREGERQVRQLQPQVVFLPDSDNDEPVTLAHNAFDPAPHPRYDLVAVSDAEDGIRLVSYDQRIDVRLARRGWHPQWNHDGSRLLITENGRDGKPQLRVLVLVWPVTVRDE